MASKLSLHIRDYPHNIWDIVQRMRPGVVKVFDHNSEMNIDTLIRLVKPVIVFRQFTKHNDFQMHAAADYVAELERTDTLNKLKGRNILWEGINEPAIGQDGTADDIKRAQALNTWTIEFARLMHERGEKVAGFSWSTGNPTDRQLAWIIPHIQEAAAAVDVHALHEYAKPGRHDPFRHWGRYRLFEQALPPEARRPVVITEAGVDEMGNRDTSGWAAHMSADQFLEVLKKYDALLNEDDYVLGATIFTLKDPAWPSFEIEGEMLDKLASYVAGVGGGAAAGEVWPVPEFEPRARAIARTLPPAPADRPIALRVRVVGEGMPASDALVRLVAGDDLLGDHPGAALEAEGVITWTNEVDDYAGNRWNAWQSLVAREVAGLTWEEFRHQVMVHNPSLAETAGELEAGTLYFLPENRLPHRSAPAVTWDRRLTGFGGSVWECWQQLVQGKVLGMTWHDFRRQFPRHNPLLAGVTGGLKAYHNYLVPRNVGGNRFYLAGYADEDGRCDFEGLAAGTYHLQVDAQGFEVAIQEVTLAEEGVTTVVVALTPLPAARAVVPGFVQAMPDQDGIPRFFLNGELFQFIGVNLRALPHYGKPEWKHHDQAFLGASDEKHIDQQLQHAQEMEARVIRVFASNKHIGPQETAERLFAILEKCKTRGLYVIAAFTDLYGNTPLHPQGEDDDQAYVGHVGADGRETALLKPEWFTGGWRSHYKQVVEAVVTRARNHPNLFAWEIGNELKVESNKLRTLSDDEKRTLLKDFMHEVAEFIHNLDPNHLITTGLISTDHVYMSEHLGMQRDLYESPHLDFLTVHAYNTGQPGQAPRPEDRRRDQKIHKNDDSILAREVDKPFIVEEAGFDAGKDENRGDRVAQDIGRWFQAGAQGYMQWGFMAPQSNMGDGDNMSGMDRVFHGDWDQLFAVFRDRARNLKSQAGSVHPGAAPPPPPPPAGFQAGQTVFTTTGVNLRESAGGAVVVVVPKESAVIILGPSQTDGDLIWWQVRAQVDGQELTGWMAQASGDQVLLSVN